MKILIIDDSALDRKLIVNILKKGGIESEILHASNGNEGLQVLSQNYKDISLILLDWQMPQLDGIEFMRAVNKVPEVASIPIVMVSSTCSEESKKYAREVNPKLAGYLGKPYSAKSLLEIVAGNIKKEEI